MSLSNNPCIITIDGPAGAGKSTVSQGLATRLGYTYIDTGAMYRSVALKAQRQSLSLDDQGAVINLTKNSEVKLNYVDGEVTVYLDGEDVSKAIRVPEVTADASDIAKIPGVREVLVGWQRKMGEADNVVIEGRDAGTVVFPNATYKFYLDADVNERTRRRLRDLKAAGKEVDEQELKKTIEARDHNDSTRKASPLKQADDAIVIDSTHLSIEQTVDEICKIMNKN